MEDRKSASLTKEIKLSASVWLFLICFLVYCVSYIARGSFSFVRTSMIGAGAVSDQIAGAISAAYFIFYAVGQLLNGFLGDRVSPFVMVVTGLIIVISTNIMMTVAQPEGMYVLWWGISGYGHSMLWSPVFFVVSTMINTKMRSFALTAISICAPVGKIASALVSGAVISQGKWQTVFFVVSMIAAGTLLLWMARYITLSQYIVMNSQKSEESVNRETEPKGEKAVKLLPMLVASGVIIMLPAMLVHGLFYNGVVELIPTILYNEYSMSATMSAIIEIIIPIASIAGVFFANFVYYKMFKENDMKSASFLMGITLIPIGVMLLLGVFKRDGYMLGQYADAIIFVTTYALVYLFQFGFNHVAIVLIPARFAKASYASTVSGIANAINYGGSAISTYGMTYALLKLELWQTVLIWIGVLLIAWFLVLAARGRWSRFVKNENRI